MSQVIVSRDHAPGPKEPQDHEVDYSFVYDGNLSSGGQVRIVRFLCKGPRGKPERTQEETGSLLVDKDALIHFVASLVRGKKIARLKDQNDLTVLGL